MKSKGRRNKKGPKDLPDATRRQFLLCLEVLRGPSVEIFKSVDGEPRVKEHPPNCSRYARLPRKSLNRLAMCLALHLVNSFPMCSLEVPKIFSEVPRPSGPRLYHVHDVHVT